MKKRATNRESARRMRALRKGEWASLVSVVDALHAENAALRARLAAVECGLDVGPVVANMTPVTSARGPRGRNVRGRAAAPPTPPLAPVDAPLPDVPGVDDLLVDERADDLLAWAAAPPVAAC